MADQRKITIRTTHATPKNIYLRELPVGTALPTTKIYLRTLHAVPKNIYLLDPTAPLVAGGFPTQYGFLHFMDGTDKQLCVVAVADANAGEGLRIRHGGTTYAIYIVDTTDPNASDLRFRASTGTRAVRLKT